MLSNPITGQSLEMLKNTISVLEPSLSVMAFRDLFAVGCFYTSPANMKQA